MSDKLFKLRLLVTWMRVSFEEWRKEVWERDLDQRYCCDGRDCMCGGSSVRDVMAIPQVQHSPEQT